MRNLLLLFCFFSLAATCQDNKSNSQDKEENPCDPDIMCTMEFKIVSLEIVDNDGKAINLDEFYSKIGDEKIEIPNDVHDLKGGLYPVVTDGQMQKLQFEGSNVIFFGLFEGEVVVEHKMVIGKDCCHIQLMEGKQKLILK